MARLSRYLLRLFTSEAMALFAVAAFLLFLIQCLRLFDVVSTRGQSLFTLLGQALLGMPSLGIVFLYVCLGIGLGRALRNLQGRSELQIIHANALVPALLRSIGMYALGGAAVLLLLAHVVDPLASRSANAWSASIAADLVSRAMIPHRFTEVIDGVSMVIGSRDSEGRITDFFADDTRGAVRQSYFADLAIITRDEQGFVLRMQNGAIQQMSEGRLSEIAFDRYDLALDALTEEPGTGDGLAQTPSYELVSGAITPEQFRVLVRRTVEGLRPLALCLFVTALAAFPTGNRRRIYVPIELTVLAAAFLERGITSYLPVPRPFDLASGPLLLALFALVVLVTKLLPRAPSALRGARPA